MFAGVNMLRACAGLWNAPRLPGILLPKKVKEGLFVENAFPNQKFRFSPRRLPDRK